jgi:hypothetical protein
VTAPLVAQVVNEIVKGNATGKGVFTLGQAFKAADFLKSLKEDDIKITSIEESGEE